MARRCGWTSNECLECELTDLGTDDLGTSDLAIAPEG